MASASFVEIISHFAGYLQIFHDIARDRIQYDDSLAPRPTGDYTTLRPNYDYRIVPDDMETAAGPVPDLMPDDPIHFVRGRPLNERRMDVEVALLACEHLGRGVLVRCGL